MLSLQISTTRDLYFALKDFLLGEVGAVEYLMLGENDVIFEKRLENTGVQSLTYLRLRRCLTNGGLSLALEAGSDPEKLAASKEDPDTIMPFDVSAGGTVSLDAYWNSPPFYLDIQVRQKARAVYLVSMDLWARTRVVFHQNHTVENSAPNFKLTKTPYIPCGV